MQLLRVGGSGAVERDGLGIHRRVEREQREASATQHGVVVACSSESVGTAKPLRCALEKRKRMVLAKSSIARS